MPSYEGGFRLLFRTASERASVVIEILRIHATFESKNENGSSRTGSVGY